MKHILFLIFICSAFLVHSQEKMDLSKAIAIGLDNNFNIKINDKSILIAKNNNTWARAGKLPTIDLTANFGNTLTQDNNPASFLQGEFFNGGLNGSVTAQWAIYNGGRVKIAKDQLDQAVGREVLNRESGIHDLLRDIIQQYYEVLFQQERLLVLESSLALSKDRLAYEETRRAFGSSNSFNIIQFENAILSDSTNLTNQRQAVEISKRTLFTTLNLLTYPNYDFDERLSIQLEDLDIDKLDQSISEDNYTLKSLVVLADLNKLNTKLEQASLLPTVSVSGSLSAAENGFQFFADNPQTGEPFGFLWSNRFSGNLTANANWRLYDGGVRKANIQNAKIQEDIDHLSYLDAKARISNQLRILADNYDNQKELLQLTDDQINLAERNLEITEERFKSGQITSIDFRNIQNQYLSAAFAKVNAIYNLVITKSEIDYLVGSFAKK